MTIRCIIVEDEPLAIDIIKDYIDKVPFLELTGVYNDAITAISALQSQQVDLIFLDLHLPKLRGLDFLGTLKSPPMVIITTAYQEFSLQSYEYGVVDYLLKPIAFSRFMLAVNKAFDRIGTGTISENSIRNDSEKDILYVSVNKKKARIDLSKVLYIESQRENIKIVSVNKTVISRYPISELEKQLPSDFIRIHRSFIVAKSKIDFFDANDVEIAGKEIPIGRSYKDIVLSALGN